MGFSNRIAKSCVHLGVVQMIFGIAGVACGAVVKSKLTGPVGATVGLWAAYVRIDKCSNIICIEVIVGRTTVIISFIITNSISFYLIRHHDN